MLCLSDVYIALLFIRSVMWTMMLGEQLSLRWGSFSSGMAVEHCPCNLCIDLQMSNSKLSGDICRVEIVVITPLP